MLLITFYSKVVKKNVFLDLLSFLKKTTKDCIHIGIYILIFLGRIIGSRNISSNYNPHSQFDLIYSCNQYILIIVLLLFLTIILCYNEKEVIDRIWYICIRPQSRFISNCLGVRNSTITEISMILLWSNRLYSPYP